MNSDDKNRDIEDAEIADQATPDEPAPEVIPEDTAQDANPDEGAPEADPTVTEDDPTPSVEMPVAEKKSGGATGMIIGGVLAAAIGAGAALAVLPEGWRHGNADALSQRLTALEDRSTGITQAELDTALASLRERVDALDSRIAELSAMVEAAPQASAVDLEPLTRRIAALEGQSGNLDTNALTSALAPLNTRVAQIEADITAQARAAVEAALAETRAEIEAQANALSNREESVAAAQARVAANAALAELIAAAESGAPAATALASVAEVATVDPALMPLGEGLMTLSALQDAFAPAARAALAAEPPAEDAPLADRMLNFLRSQTGARSLAPREGDDTDAILSRAEAALRQGDIGGALSELDDLADAPAQELQAWRADAQTRLDALTALSALGETLTRNED